MPLVLLLALASVTLREAVYPLRDGCAAGDKAIAELHQGDEVRIKFAIAGDGGGCFKVTTAKGDGYLPASALSSTEEFEKARQAGAVLEITKVMNSEVAAIGKAAATSNDPLISAVRMLEANRPDQALGVLQSRLSTGRRDPQVLALAGVAAYRSDDVRRAAWYWKESLELRPNAGIQQMYDKAVKELSADLSAEKKFGARFVLRYDGQAVGEETAREMVAALEQEYVRINAELGCHWDERIAAIVQTREAYMKSSDAAEWSAGQYDGRIRIALVEGNTLGAKTRRVFAHEITHACLASLGRWPAWLHEGLAQRLSGDTMNPALKRQLKSAVRGGAMPRFDRLSQDWSRLSPQHAAQAYGLALAAVETFYEEYAQLGMRNLLKNPQMLPQVVDHLNRKFAE